MVGWFSVHEVIATVGDELAADVVRGWLDEAGIAHDTARADFLGAGIDWRTADPGAYTDLVFVGGPLSADPTLAALLARFPTARRLAVNASVLDAGTAARFDVVLPRDGRRSDLAAAAPVEWRPVLAVLFAPVQSEYADRSRAARVRRVLTDWLATRGLPWYEVSTDSYADGRERDPAEVVSLLARADVVLSMRLHGLALGLAAGVPVIACDPVDGGAKVADQAAAVGWALFLLPADLSADRLDDALQRCLHDPPLAAAASALASSVAGTRAEVMAALRRD